MNNTDAVGYESAASIARKTQVSKNTVGRFLRRIGFEGMNGFKHELLKVGNLGSLYPNASRKFLADATYAEFMHREIEGVSKLFTPAQSKLWEVCVRSIFEAENVGITGFQTVRGVAEDFQKRMSIARDNTFFFSPHDGFAAEFFSGGESLDSTTVVMIDVAPYAKETEAVSKLLHDLGVSIVFVTNEVNSWAGKYTDMVLPISTSSGMFADSIGPICSCTNLLVHAVAELDPDSSKKRMEIKKRFTSALDVFRQDTNVAHRFWKTLLSGQR